ncbi:Hypothetical protein HVR_LOCUS692 [uncultured virus]|nr:Hypothetical protein HVR_LOCUS692 [uncultured virus]
MVTLNWILDTDWKDKLMEDLSNTKTLGYGLLCDKLKSGDLKFSLEELIRGDSSQISLYFCLCVADCATFCEEDDIAVLAGELLAKIYQRSNYEEKNIIIDRINSMINFGSYGTNQIYIRRHGATLALMLLQNISNCQSDDRLMYYAKDWAHKLTEKEYYKYVATRGNEIAKFI